MASIENHYGTRSNWLRAAVLGANDGILSTASIIIGVAAASTIFFFLLDIEAAPQQS